MPTPEENAQEIRLLKTELEEGFQAKDRKIRTLLEELERTKEELNNSKIELENTKEDLATIKSELSEAIKINQSAISSTRTNLQNAKSELKQVIDGATKLKKLDVASNSAHAFIAAHDLWFGHPSRKGNPGRAIVDGKDRLMINYGYDDVDPGWSLVEIGKELRVGEIKISSPNTIASTGRMHVSGAEKTLSAQQRQRNN